MADFAALAAALAAWPGHRLMTVMAYGAGHSHRLWSSRPALWPIGGGKPLPPGSDLHQRLIIQGEPRLLDGADAIRAAFADHALILAEGLGAAVNVPVRAGGRTVGAVNLLHVAGHYSGLDLPRLAALADSAAPLMQT